MIGRLSDFSMLFEICLPGWKAVVGSEKLRFFWRRVYVSVIFIDTSVQIPGLDVNLSQH